MKFTPNLTGIHSDKVEELVEGAKAAKLQLPPSAISVQIQAKELAANLPGLLEQADAILKNPSLDSDTQQVRAYTHVQQNAGRKVDKILGRLEGLSEELEHEKSLLAATKKMTPEEAAIAGEVRQYVRGLKDRDRANYLRTAASNGEAGVLRAVLAGPKEITGLGDKAYHSVEKSLYQLAAPERAQLVDTLNELGQRAITFTQSAEKVVGQYRTPRVGMLLEAAAALPDGD